MAAEAIETFADGQALADAAAGAVIATLDAALRRKGTASMAATGGRSPGPLYDALSAAPLDWPRIRITLSDERWVDAASPDSNEALVRRRLLRGRAADAAFHGLRGHERTLEAAAEQASDWLHAWPPFDVVVLGMGEDGHVASMFPGSPVLERAYDQTADAIIAVPEGEGGPPSQPRLTLTLGPIARAGLVLILTGGKAKRAVLEKALAGADPYDLPVAAVLQSACPVRILWTEQEPEPVNAA